MRRWMAAAIIALLFAACSREPAENRTPAAKAWQKVAELETQLTERLARARVLLGWRDVANRLAIAGGQMSAPQADQDLREYGARLTESEFGANEVAEERSRLEAAAQRWLDGIAQTVASSQSWPDGGSASFWRERAERNLHSVRDDLPDWLGEDLDPSARLEDAARVSAWAQGQSQATSPFTDHDARVLGAFPERVRPRLTGGGNTATVPPAEAASGAIGCFRDTSDYDLDGHLERSAENTPSRCIAICKAKGFAYAGVQYGESCLCGNSYGRHGKAEDSACNHPCTGDRSQTCGGYSTNTVYSIAGNDGGSWRDSEAGEDELPPLAGEEER